jgi:DNA integrity scanning protein DisA with diadenylate cyclase activity
VLYLIDASVSTYLFWKYYPTLTELNPIARNLMLEIHPLILIPYAIVRYILPLGLLVIFPILYPKIRKIYEKEIVELTDTIFYLTTGVLLVLTTHGILSQIPNLINNFNNLFLMSS